MSRRHGGFTLVEIMVVVVIIGLLAGIVGPRILDQLNEAKVKTTGTQIANLGQSLELFHLDNGFFPTTAQGLKALVEKPNIPPEPKNYKRGYLNTSELPKDGWGNDFIYRCPGERNDYDIISLGADAKEDGEGFNADIINK